MEDADAHRAEGWRLMQARDGRTWRACQERNRIGTVRPLSSAQRLVDGLDGRGSARCGENIDSGNVGLFLLPRTTTRGAGEHGLAAGR